MTVSKELAREQIDKFERSMTRSKWKLENQDLSQESVSRIHGTVGRKEEEEEAIGLYQLLLGDVAAATERLEEATRRYALKYEHERTYEAEENDQATWQTQRYILERLTYAALLSRNDARSTSRSRAGTFRTVSVRSDSERPPPGRAETPRFVLDGDAVQRDGAFRFEDGFDG